MTRDLVIFKNVLSLKLNMKDKSNHYNHLQLLPLILGLKDVSLDIKHLLHTVIAMCK